MSSACKPLQVAFYGTQNYKFGHVTEHSVTPTIDGDDARCSGPALWPSGSNKDCPKGWKFVEQTGDGCSSRRVRSLCEYDDYPTDAKTLARCCVGKHSVGKMSDEGKFSSSAKPCPADYCVDKQGGSACTKALQSHCRTQFGIGKEDNEMCWRWATAVAKTDTSSGDEVPKRNWMEGIDAFCRDDGAKNGSALVHNTQCAALVADPLFAGTLDNSASAYCSSALGKQRTKESGEKICSCFSGAAVLSPEVADLVARDLAVLPCWSTTCFEKGYKTQDMLRRMTTCGDFCNTVIEIENTDVTGDVDIDLACKDLTGKAVNELRENLRSKAHNVDMSSPGADGTKPSNKTTTVVLIILASVALLFVLLAIVYAVGNSLNKDDDFIEPFMSSANTMFAAPPNFFVQPAPSMSPSMSPSVSPSVSPTPPLTPIVSRVAQVQPATVLPQQLGGTAQYPAPFLTQPQEIVVRGMPPY